MKRRTLDLIFAVGGVAVAMLVIVLGLVLQNQANFAKNYVHDQLAAQKINFTPAKFLSAEENDPCLQSYGGKPLVTGKQAACYANHYIGVHVKSINDGKTYAETSSAARALDTKAEALDPNSAEAKQISGQAQVLHGKATTLFQGETLRGLLLTSYGFSIFGERAQQVADVAFALAVVLLLASFAGFVHALTKKAQEPVLSHHEPVESYREPVMTP
jgi:hypothetical protein